MITRGQESNGACQGLSVYGPPKAICGNPSLTGVALGGGPFGGGQVRRVEPSSGISALIRRDRGQLASSLCSPP